VIDGLDEARQKFLLRGELLGRVGALQQFLGVVGVSRAELLEQTDDQLIELAEQLELQLRDREMPKS